MLAMTILYERLEVKKSWHRSTAELYHLCQATKQFRSRLFGPLNSQERDAIWATSSILGSLSLASLDAITPEESWPFKPIDLSWLKMNQGKIEVWRIVDLTRADSIFNFVNGETEEWKKQLTPRLEWLDSLPEALLQFLGLDQPSNSSGNPLLTTALFLARIYRLEFRALTVFAFHAWLGHLEPQYTELLVQKDPRALLLLAYWFRKLRDHQMWFMWQRSTVECEAICLYLERNHADLPHLKTLLAFPRGVCDPVEKHSSKLIEDIASETTEARENLDHPRMTALEDSTGASGTDGDEVA